MRGGSFIVDGNPDPLNAADRGNRLPGDEDYKVGFRVSAVPEPATLSLLALGGLLAIRRRR